MKIKFSKRVKGPLRVSSGQAYERLFEGNRPFEIEPKHWPILKRVRVLVETGKDAGGNPEIVSSQAFDLLEESGPAAEKPAETPAPAARPVAVAGMTPEGGN